MKLTFKPYYFAVFYSLLLIEIAIALFLDDGFIRHTFGDFLVVILLYAFIKSFVTMQSYLVALLVLFIAFVIECLQLYNVLEIFSLQENTFFKTVFGISFSYQDLLAYTLGALFSFIADSLIIKKNSTYEFN
ncbi:ribosomal maturation YjgA family protein [Lacinutrix chionoecetis]